MYKVLLVDDEVLIREAISTVIHWNELGYELIGTCKDGKEALRFIEENPPHLLITDICMPHVDGLELVKYVYQNHPDVKTIIISGYDEFDYAKQAMKYQVLEYILKPITALEFSETLLRIHETLDQDVQKENNIKKIRSAYMSNLPILRSRFLNSILENTITKDILLSKFHEFQIHLDGNYFAVIKVEGDSLSLHDTYTQSPQGDLGLFGIYNITDEIIASKQCGVVLQNPNEQTLAILSNTTRNGLTETLESISNEIQQSIYQFLQIETTIGIGRIVASIEHLNQSYETMKNVMECKFLLGGNQIYFARDFGQKLPPSSINTKEWIDKLLVLVKTNSMTELKAHMNFFFESLKNTHGTKTRIMLMIQNTVLSIMNLVDSAGLSDSTIIEKEKAFLNTLYEQEQLSQIQLLLFDFCKTVSTVMSTHKDGYGKKQALLALDYMDKNYHDSSISLNSICTHLAISTSYFSAIFKSYTGETFVESLTKKRMEQAMLLLENSSLKSYEVADEVGFSDPHYFSIIFKKHTGLTPTEYVKRKRLL